MEKLHIINKNRRIYRKLKTEENNSNLNEIKKILKIYIIKLSNKILKLMANFRYFMYYKRR